MHHETTQTLQERLTEAGKRIAELEDLLATARREAGNRPRESDKIVQALLNSSLQAVCLMDRSGTILAINVSGAERLGHSASELLGRCVYDFLPDGVAQRRRRHVEEVLRTGEPFRFEDRHDDRWLDNTVYPIRDESGKTTKILVQVDDITERKRMEEELHKSHDDMERRVEQRTAQLRRSEEVARTRLAEIEAYYNLAPVGLAILDQHLRFVRVNQRLADLTGVPCSGHLGRTIHEVLPKKLADWFASVARGILESGEPMEDMEITSLVTGVKKSAQVSCFPLHDPEGQLTGIGAIVEDITERKRFERELRQTQKMEAMGTLSTGIAHDFNNILTAILGFTDLSYDETPTGSKVKTYLLRVLNAANRGKELVNQILSFSRRGEAELKPTLLGPVVKESVKMLRASLPKTIEIRAALNDESAVALADPVQIQQIVMNLGTNAGYAMWERGGLMTVDLSCVTIEGDTAPLPDMAPGPYLRLAVTDTGTGMDKDVLDRAFDPFFTTKRRGEGTGLGLWVVHSIVKNHRGFISLASDPGRGSTVEVFFPQSREAPLRISKQHGSVDNGYGRILVVDDETEVAEMEKIMLERMGYDVTAVTDSLLALDLFKKSPERYDLVLTDHSMPGMTGVDLVRELTSIRSTIPVILITGYRDVLNAAEARQAGVGLIVPKPMTRVDLGTAIKRVLRTAARGK